VTSSCIPVDEGFGSPKRSRHACIRRNRTTPHHLHRVPLQGLYQQKVQYMWYFWLMLPAGPATPKLPILQPPRTETPRLPLSSRRGNVRFAILNEWKGTWDSKPRKNTNQPYSYRSLILGTTKLTVFHSGNHSPRPAKARSTTIRQQNLLKRVVRPPSKVSVLLNPGFGGKITPSSSFLCHLASKKENPFNFPINLAPISASATLHPKGVLSRGLHA
jgi:hypothetical protein